MCMIIFLELNGYEVVAPHKNLMRLVRTVVLCHLDVYTIKNRCLKKYTRKLKDSNICDRRHTNWKKLIDLLLHREEE